MNVVAGGSYGKAADYVYMNHRLAYAEAGQWGIFRVLAPGTPQIAALDSHDTGNRIIETANRDDKPLPWVGSVMVFALCGFGVLLVRGGSRGTRMMGLLLAFLALTYFAAAALAADEEAKSGTIRSLKSYNPDSPVISGEASAKADKRIRPLASYNRHKSAPKVWATYIIPQSARGKLAPLPEISPPNPFAAELGKMLFFDNRVSGDADISCATCHQPGKGWADGEALSTGYPGTRYFRNTPTIINAVYADYLYWDGRLGGDDPATQVRDSINDSHFMSSDGRVMLERMKQIPEYVELFEKGGLGEPTHTGITKAIAAFERTLVSRNVPFDNYLKGDGNALSAQAKQGLELFKGKAGCVQCHNGPYLADQKPHNLGLPENPEVFSDPFRVVTFRSQLKFVGTPNYMNLRNDPGHFAVSKLYKDFGKFITPTLREVSRTAPYMHNGMLPTLEAVVDFYNAGGGIKSRRKDPLLKPLNLSAGERSALIEFLKSLSGEEIIMQVAQKELPGYKIIKNWYATKN